MVRAYTYLEGNHGGFAPTSISPIISDLYILESERFVYFYE
jgi:hypothetical protein